MEKHTLEYIKSNTSGRIMSVDFGDTRTGLALSDTTRYLASGIGYVSPGGIVKTADKVAEMAVEKGASAVVVGLPKNMDGTEGPRAELYRAFAQQVEEATGLKPVLWDERRTTVDAHRILFESGQNAKKRKKTVDAVAASLILEGYLDFKRLRG